MPAWALAFLTAVLITVIGTPMLRRLALVVGLVDTPGDHKSHHIPTPYLGGIGIIVSVAVGLALYSDPSPRAGALMVSAIILGTIGLLDDDRNVAPRYRFLAQLVAGAGAAALGVRIVATGVGIIDIALTLIWIIGATNAFNLLDNMDGLTAGVAAVVAGAVFWLAILSPQPALASVSAAVMGACLGFLVYNRPPASIFLGDAGSLFLGFVIAILTIEVRPALMPPFGFIVPLIMLGLPVLDTTTVTLGRLRRGRKVSRGGRDHLSHRLVAQGLSRSRAVLVLIGVEAVLGLLAVLAGRRVVQLRWTALGAVGILAALSFVTSRAQVYQETMVGLPRKLKFSLGAVLVGLPILSLPALLAVARAAGPARQAADTTGQALQALAGDDAPRSAAQFGAAGLSFARAEGDLSTPFASLGLAVPGVSSNLRATRTIVSIGRRLADAGTRLAVIADDGAVEVRSGRVDVDAVRGLGESLTQAAGVLRDSRDRLAAIDQPFLLPPLQRAVRSLAGRVTGELATVERAAQTAQLLPDILGSGGTRRYFVAFQNNAEIRGTGGFIGNFGELVASKGSLRLERFGRIQELNDVNPQTKVLDVAPEFSQRWGDFQPQLFWQQVNISPDFPTTAGIINQLYPQSGGQPVDGVIAIDPVGLAALLELTGPVTVPKWPEPITSTNVVDVTLRGAYARFPVNDERVEFLGDLSRRVTTAVTGMDLHSPRELAAALSQAARNGHLSVTLNKPREQGLVRNLGVDGAVPAVQGDSLMIVNQNVSANKVDLYLRRTLSYDVRLQPGRSAASLTGRLEVTLQNDAPSEGLPPGVIGPYDDRFLAGENRTYLSIYSPFVLRSATLDGRDTPLTSAPDLGRIAHSAFISIPSRSRRTLALDLEGRLRLTSDGWYRLDLPHQTTLRPDEVTVGVEVPQGWRIAETRGADAVTGRRAEARIQLDREHTVWVRVERSSGWSRVRDRLLGR